MSLSGSPRAAPYTLHAQWQILPETQSQKMVSHVDVREFRRAHRVLCQIPRPLVILENRDACLTKTRKKKHNTYLKNIASFMVSASATYSASVVECVTRFCVLENQHTLAPAHITASPEIDLLSVALLA